MIKCTIAKFRRRRRLRTPNTAELIGDQTFRTASRLSAEMADENSSKNLFVADHCRNGDYRVRLHQ